MNAPATRGTRSVLADSVAALRAAATNGQIRRLLVGWTLGIGADWAFLVVALVVVEAEAGLVAVGAVTAVRMIPATLVALFARPEALGRAEAVLVLVNLVRAAAAAVAAVAAALGAPLLVGLAIAVVGGAGSLVRPTQSAILPGLATRPAELVAANVSLSLGEALGTFAGPLAIALVLALGGDGTDVAGFAITCLAFLAAAVASRVRLEDAARAEPMERRTPPLVAGLRALAHHGGASVVVAAFLLQVAVRAVLTVLIVVLAEDLLRLGGSGVGMLNAAVGAGGVLGGLGSLLLATRRRLAPVFVVALVGWGVPLAVIGVMPTTVVAVSALAVVGLANAVLDVAGFTLLQRTLSNAERAPVFGLFEGGVGAMSATAGVLAPLLILAIGARETLVVIGLCLPVAAVLAWLRIRSLDDESVVPEERAHALRADPLFRNLPLAAIERLAVDAHDVELAAGDALMREGEPGDRYLLITAGSATVTRGGGLVRTLGPGDGAGEIALLRDTPRTATVVATEPTRAIAIDRATFLAAVTGHRESAATASGVIGSRLAEDASREGPGGTGSA